MFCVRSVSASGGGGMCEPGPAVAGGWIIGGAISRFRNPFRPSSRRADARGPRQLDTRGSQGMPARAIQGRSAKRNGHGRAGGFPARARHPLASPRLDAYLGDRLRGEPAGSAL